MRIGPRALFPLAVASVLVLMALSDFGPARPSALSEVDDDGASELSVIIISSRPCANGHLLNLSDGSGGQVDAFCPSTVYPDVLQNGTLARVTVVRSANDPGFLIVQRLLVSDDPSGKD